MSQLDRFTRREHGLTSEQIHTRPHRTPWAARHSAGAQGY